MLLKFEPMPKGPEARGYEAEAKILALSPVWPRGTGLEAVTSLFFSSPCFGFQEIHEFEIDEGQKYNLIS